MTEQTLPPEFLQNALEAEIRRLRQQREQLEADNLFLRASYEAAMAKVYSLESQLLSQESTVEG